MTDEQFDSFIYDADDIEVEEVTKEETPSKWQWLKENGPSFLGKVVLAIIPAIITALVNKREYKDYIYTTDQSGVTYKLPAREMHSIAGKTNRNVSSEMSD